jgi:hypothetical protein
MSLVIWILVFKRGLKQLKCYVDDIFSFSKVDDIAFYRPYSRYIPTNQVKVLQLWDEIRLPHEDGKQISGRIIPCIGFNVDPNLMTVSMNPEKRATLVEACEIFVSSGKRRSLQDFQHLSGHINWALNVYPRMQPALATIHAKISGKTRALASVRINNDIRHGLFVISRILMGFTFSNLLLVST